MTDALHWLADAAERRAAAGLRRELRSRPPGPAVQLDLASNDYLGLTRHPAVVAAARAALEAYGAGSTGSRLVTGTIDLHGELEQALAAFTGTAAGLVFSSGYLANLAAVTSLAGPRTLVVSDADNHASLVDACRLSRAETRVVPHRDVEAVRAALASRTTERAVVVTDAVFSVDGDLAPLAELHAAARAYGAVLLVDEAHGLGVVGPSGAGASAAAGLAGEPDVVLTVTLSKSLGSQGGAVLGPEALRGHMIDTARSFIFDTGLNPAAAGAALAALGLVDTARVGAVHRVARALADAVGVRASAGAVVRVPVGDPNRAVRAQQACAEEGVRVGCFRPPSVPVGGSCLRLTARADLSDEDLTRGTTAVRRALVQ
ncbi:MAG: 8-amino-7-oxononanoate synthase [Frankiales bacterium]|nr:8-amino-7-oxononanoate synthase [Frankiales bacterium]